VNKLPSLLQGKGYIVAWIDRVLFLDNQTIVIFFIVQNYAIFICTYLKGYNASKSIYKTNQAVGAKMPIAENIYKILWGHLNPQEGFNKIENILV